MPERDATEPWKRITALVEERNTGELQTLLEELPPSVVARALTLMDDEDRHGLLTLLEPEEAADLIEELSDAQGADILEDLPAADAAAIVEEMESHERADLLAELDEEDAEAILREMDPEEAEDARHLLTYEENTAGGIMMTEFAAYREETTVREVIKDLRDNAEMYTEHGLQYAYVESAHGTLIGVLRLRDLLFVPPDTPLKNIMIVNPICVLSSTSLDEMDDFFDRYPFFNVPVTDEEGHLVGVARRSDMEEAIGEEQERTFLRFSGIIGGEELRSMPMQERVSRRLAWLSLNLLLSIMAASVLLFFEKTVEVSFALVFFMPVVANICGCSGNQAVAVSIRELALGLIEPGDFVRVWFKELGVGLANGLALGGIIALVAGVLAHFYLQDSAWLGPLIGLAFLLNSMVAVTLGGLIPLLLRSLGMDAALGAPPMLTTLTDMMGFALVCGLVTLAIHFGLVPVP